MNDNILFTIRLLSIIFFTSQLCIAQHIEQKPGSSFDIKNKANELGITAGQLEQLLKSSQNNGKPGRDPLPEAMQEKFFSGQSAGDNFGYSVSTAGDVNGDGYSDVIVGAYHNDVGGADAGRAYIYFGGNIINSVADVVLTGAAANDLFGNSVSTAGDVNGDGYSDVIVGALRNDAGGIEAGRAYIYFGGSSMNNTSDVILTGAAANDLFGISVSTAGDVNGDGYPDVIVGAYYNDAGGADAGSAYIYYGGNIVNSVADVILTGAAAGDVFGISVSTAGDVNGDGYSDVIVGAPYNDAGGSSAGRAYTYFGGSSMDNTSDVILTGAAASDFFGYSVSTAGDVNGDGYSDVIVGAPYNDAGGSSAGRAYTYLGGSSMDNTSDVILTGAAANDYFGYSVSTAGDVNGDGYSDVIVGAYLNDAGGNAAGRAYIYLGDSSMDNTLDLILTGAEANDRFGNSVSNAGDVNGDGYSDVIVGAFENNAGGADAGRAYLYINSLTGTDIPDEFFTGVAAGDLLGRSVSTAGDVNGDGYSDVIVGALRNAAGGTDAGRAYIYFGGKSMNNTSDVILTGAASGDMFGISVSTAGDVNGDGYSDVIVGAEYNNAGGLDAGRAYIYFGGSSMDNASDVILTGAAADERFGSSVSTAGDVNGDGYSDVIVGAYGSDAGGSIAGRAYIYFGGSGMDSTSDVILTGAAAYERLGCSVSTAGDVNSDGYSDVIVGAFRNDAGGTDAGRAYIYFGGSSMNHFADVILTGATAYGYFGYSVSTACDINGDGYSDVIVGAPHNDGFAGGPAGCAYLYFGGVSMDSTSDVILTGTEADDQFGYSVSTAGDVNGDGYSDVIVGADYNSAGGPMAGRAYIYFGGSSVDNTSDVILTGADWDVFGYSVSNAGDVNRDGCSDVIVGAPYNAAGGTDAGRAYLYLSSAPPIIPRIMSAKDVPFDQGGFVKLKWVRSGYDVQGISMITDYLIQRSDPPDINGFAWENIASMIASNEPFYSYVAGTPNDSMLNNSGTYYFRVTARTSDPNQYWRSNIMSGHSADNLAPAAPLNFYANLLTGQVKLGWIANTEEDLKNYIIYRTDDPGANPDTLEVFAEVLDTTFIDTNPLPETAYYYLKSQDVHNNLSNYVSVTVSAQTTFTLSVSVTDGWNMVSVPGVHPTNQNVSTWWPNRNILADVYRWTTTYVPVTLAAPTQGYWMLHNGTQTYNTGDEWPAGGIQIVARDPIPLTAGWNMIGGYENSPLVSGLTTTPPGLIVAGTIYGWTGTYTNATNLVPGFGYWILSTGNGVINSPTVADGSAKLVVQDDKSEWGKITITDASGKSYTLYSVDGKVNLDQYQMPPLPPTGMFDVRYSSNRKAEDLKDGSQTIEMRGLVYPVTVRAEKIGIKLEDETGKMVSERLKSGEEVVISNNAVSKLKITGAIIPEVYLLEQNYPNPFNPSTKIEFSIPEDVNNITLTIYNALGQRVTELVNSKHEAGKYSYVWNASEVATGLYIYELRTDKFVSVKKMILLK